MFTVDGISSEVKAGGSIAIMEGQVYSLQNQRGKAVIRVTPYEE